MSLTTKANVLIIAPSLSTVSDDLWNFALNNVGYAISTSVFGVRTEEAARYWVAHKLTLLAESSSSAAAGPMIKERVGDVMREYAKPQSVSESNSDYARTKYGIEFLAIRKSMLAAFGVVVPGV